MLGGGLGFVRGAVVDGECEVEVEVVFAVVLGYGLEFGPVALTSERSVLPCRRRTGCYRRPDCRRVVGIVVVGFGCSQPVVDSQQKTARRRRKRVGREG